MLWGDCMSFISFDEMTKYLAKSISSINQNKLNGLLAEIEFRNYIETLGFEDRVSIGGWLARGTEQDAFGHNNILMLPEKILPEKKYPCSRTLPRPQPGIQAMAAKFHEIGISSYFCAATIGAENEYQAILWNFTQLGLPRDQPYVQFPLPLAGFQKRQRNYGFLRYSADTDSIPEHAIPEEFSKEHLRVTFNQYYFAQIVDIDGILWGNQTTYPFELKEKTAATDSRIGDWFGLDVGPFIKLAFFAAKRGNLHSLFIVREIDDTSKRNLVKWWYITFENLAQYASWKTRGGGQGMSGEASTVVMIPKAEFKELNISTLQKL